VDKGASDLHLKVGSKPILRIDGALVKQDEIEELSVSKIMLIFESIASRKQQDIFYTEKELDFHYSVPGLARFRVSALWQRKSLSLAFRVIPYEIMSIDDLELPQIYKELALKPRGLILVTGPTGSGKTTTLASMIKHLNENEAKLIITIEDPIEYLYSDNKCIINQRNIGEDTKSFNAALIHALRHDPDVIILGEIRDTNTISTAITAAETGHLVMGTLHTTDAAQTIDRVIDVFPPSQQQQIRLQLSQVLEAVLSQILVRKLDGSRIAATEIMIATPAVRNVIREGQVYKIPNIIQMSSKDGMHTLEQSLVELIQQNLISREEAITRTSKPDQLDKLIHNKQRAKPNNNNNYPQFESWSAAPVASGKIAI